MNPQGTYGQRGSTTPQFVDTVLLITGGHTLKFGDRLSARCWATISRRAIRRDNSTSPAALTNPQAPTNTGSQLAQFLVGAVSSTAVGTYMGESERGYSISSFLQDDWKVSRRLTLTWACATTIRAPPTR